jgi:Chaperone of endosialidase
MSYTKNQNNLSVNTSGQVSEANELEYTGPVVTMAAGVTEQATVTTTRTQGTYLQPPQSGGPSTTGATSNQTIRFTDSLSVSNIYGSFAPNHALEINLWGYAGVDDIGDPFGGSVVGLFAESTSGFGSTLKLGERRVGLGPSASTERCAVLIDASSARIAGYSSSTTVGSSGTLTFINGGGGATAQQIRFGCGVSNTPVAYFNQTSSYAYKLAGTAWTVFSDARLKQNIRPINNALDKINALNPIHYEYINAGEGKYPTGTRTGFIAQDVEQVLPGHVVEQDPVLEEDKAILGEGVKAKMLDADWIPYLVKATQELNLKLEQENSVLKQQIAALSARLDALEAK